MKKITRRDFVKKATLGSVALAGVGSLTNSRQDTAFAAAGVPEKWDKETDVVVVGYGGAGAVSAITASEKGDKVIIIEKAPEPGGSTSCSSGGMKYPTNVEKITRFIVAVGQGTVDEETAKAFAELWIGVPGWLTEHGAQLFDQKRIPEWKGIFPGDEALNGECRIKRQDNLIGVGRDLFSFLEGLVKRQPVDIMLKTPAKRLIQHPTTKEILGLKAENNGKDINIKARKAVILTCGGFAGNREMLHNFIQEAAVPMYASGTPYSTGDGIRMVIDVGADLWHMNGIEWARQGILPPGFKAAFWMAPNGWSWMNVNKYGKRFMDEGDTYAHAKKPLEVFNHDVDKVEWPNHPWVMIFDEKTRKAGPIIMTQRAPGRATGVTYNLSREIYSWSEDNSAEIQKGWIKQAGTIAELAAKTGIDPVGLQETVTKYNDYCKNGKDPDFKRKSKILIPIETPPFYSAESVVNIINTQGGPRRNAKSQVMGVYGEPILRLYAAGEFGSIWSFFYPGACNLPELIVSGVLSGRNAAAEAPWG